MMSEQLERVRAEVMTVELDGEVYVFAEDYAALLAERDALEAELERFKEERGYVVGFNDGWQALEAENQRLREALEWVSQNGGFAHPGNIVSVAKSALAEQEKTNDQ